VTSLRSCYLSLSPFLPVRVRLCLLPRSVSLLVAYRAHLRDLNYFREESALRADSCRDSRRRVIDNSRVARERRDGAAEEEDERERPRALPC